MPFATDPPPSSPSKLVLLGAGHAHLQVLANMARQPWAGVEVTLVTPHPTLLHFPMAAGFVAGRYALEACSLAIEPMVRAAGLTWLPRSVVGLDANRRRVKLDDGTELAYHWLSINTGAVQDRDKIELELPGAREHGLFVRPFASLGLLWPKVVELAASRALRIAVVGGGDSGIELAMAIRQRLPQVALTLVAGQACFATEAPADMRERLASALKQRRINVLPDRAVRLDGSELTLASRARLACDVAVIATGVSAPVWLQGSGLALDAQGFASVDACQRSSSHANVFASGDISTRLDGLLPRNGRAAMVTGPRLAANLAAVTAGRLATAWVPSANTLKLLGYGDGRAIAAWGHHVVQGRMAWWYKDWLDRSFVRRHSRIGPPDGYAAQKDPSAPAPASDVSAPAAGPGHRPP